MIIVVDKVSREVRKRWHPTSDFDCSIRRSQPIHLIGRYHRYRRYIRRCLENSTERRYSTREIVRRGAEKIWPMMKCVVQDDMQPFHTRR